MYITKDQYEKLSKSACEETTRGSTYLAIYSEWADEGWISVLIQVEILEHKGLDVVVKNLRNGKEYSLRSVYCRFIPMV